MTSTLVTFYCLIKKNSHKEFCDKKGNQESSFNVEK